MNPEYYHGSYHLGYQGPHAGHPMFDQYTYYPTYQTTPLEPTTMLRTQYIAVWDVRNGLHRTPTSSPTILPISPTSPQASDDGSSFVSAHQVFDPVQPQARSQHAWRSPTVMGIRTSAPDATSRTDDVTNSQAHYGRTQRKLIPQVPYRAAKQQRDVEGPWIIEFSVYGEKGIRLSDALEENWAGFEGRDDRSLFGDDRVQIMIRLHIVGCPALQQKIYTTDHTTRRQPITRTKLAYEVAKNVKKFLEREKNGHGDCSRCSWKDVPLGDMYLTRLYRVSNASWQPELFFEQSSTVTMFA